MQPAAVVLGYLDERALGWTPFVGRRRSANALLAESVEAPTWRVHGASLDRDELVDYVLARLKDEDVRPIPGRRVHSAEQPDA